MEDKVRKMQLLKDNEKKELVSTLQNGEFTFFYTGGATVSPDIECRSTHPPPSSNLPLVHLLLKN